jgi:hypothetical protein
MTVMARMIDPACVADDTTTGKWGERPNLLGMPGRKCYRACRAATSRRAPALFAAIACGGLAVALGIRRLSRPRE